MVRDVISFGNGLGCHLNDFTQTHGMDTWEMLKEKPQKKLCDLTEKKYDQTV